MQDNLRAIVRNIPNLNIPFMHRVVQQQHQLAVARHIMVGLDE